MTTAHGRTAPCTVTVNGELRELPPGRTLDQVVAELTTAPSGVAAAVNEAVVPRGRWSGTALTDGDRVEVLTAVQGG
jgi:sulfur carrier protein